MLSVKTSLLDTKAAVPYSALFRKVLWSTCGEAAPKNTTPTPPKFFTVKPVTRTLATGVTTLPLLSKVPWMHMPCTDDGSLGLKQTGDCLVGGDVGGTTTVAP